MTSTPTKPVDNVVIATKGLQDRNTNVTAGTRVENKGKLILTYRNTEKCTVLHVLLREVMCLLIACIVHVNLYSYLLHVLLH